MSTLASVQMSVTYKSSKSSPEAPCSYLSVSVAVKDIKNILVAKLSLFCNVDWPHESKLGTG